MIYRTIFFFIVVLCAASCQQKNYDAEFIADHGNDSFKKFVNTIFYFRSIDQADNAIYFFGDLADSCEAPYIVTVNTKTLEPISVDLKLRKPPCDQVIADTVNIKDLTEQFLKYKVSFLKVDKDSVVYVNVDRAEEADLIRLPKSIPPEQFKNVRTLTDNWYTKIEK